MSYQRSNRNFLVIYPAGCRKPAWNNQKGQIQPDPDVTRVSPNNDQNNTGWYHIVQKLLADIESSSLSVDVKNEQSSLLQLHVMMSDYIYYGTFQTSFRFLVHHFKWICTELFPYSTFYISASRIGPFYYIKFILIKSSQISQCVGNFLAYLLALPA